MTCPKCDAGNSSVEDTEPSAKGIRRRRQCSACRYRWTTWERNEPQASVERYHATLLTNELRRRIADVLLDHESLDAEHGKQLVEAVAFGLREYGGISGEAVMALAVILRLAPTCEDWLKSKREVVS